MAFLPRLSTRYPPSLSVSWCPQANPHPPRFRAQASSPQVEVEHPGTNSMDSTLPDLPTWATLCLLQGGPTEAERTK